MAHINLFDPVLWERLITEGRGIVAIRMKDEEYLEVFIEVKTKEDRCHNWFVKLIGAPFLFLRTANNGRSEFMVATFTECFVVDNIEDWRSHRDGHRVEIEPTFGPRVMKNKKLKPKDTILMQRGTEVVKKMENTFNKLAFSKPFETVIQNQPAS